jgi:hypothetical protein
MGGVPPLGYWAQDRNLISGDSEAEVIRAICSVVLRGVRARGHRRAHPRQDRRLAATQRRLAERAQEIGKRWPELPMARRRAVLTALIDCIAAGIDRIDVCLHSAGCVPCCHALRWGRGEIKRLVTSRLRQWLLIPAASTRRPRRGSLIRSSRLGCAIRRTSRSDF